MLTSLRHKRGKKVTKQKYGYIQHESYEAGAGCRAKGYYMSYSNYKARGTMLLLCDIVLPRYSFAAR